MATDEDVKKFFADNGIPFPAKSEDTYGHSDCVGNIKKVCHCFTNLTPQNLIWFTCEEKPMSSSNSSPYYHTVCGGWVYGGQGSQGNSRHKFEDYKKTSHKEMST